MTSVSTRSAVRLLLVGWALLVAPERADAQQPLLSPRDSTEIRLEGKRLFIDYGRPSMRGRKIFGGLVPFNRWWRTGANEATSLILEADVFIGDSLIRAGAYTIYTLPGEKRWQLIVNAQTGQWGTVYNPLYDRYRLPMTPRRLRKPVEVFTILFRRTSSSSAALVMRWERTEVSIPIRSAAATSRQK